MSTSAIVASSLQSSTRSANLTVQDLANKNVLGATNTQQFWVPGIASSTGGSGANLVSQKNMMEQGQVVSTGQTFDIAVQSGDGVGLVPVLGSDGAQYFATDTSFRIGNAKKELMNASGASLLVWKLDNAGKLPSNSTSFSSLVTASLRDIASNAEATSNAKLSVNLSADEAWMQGPGDLIDLSVIGAAKEDDKTSLIIPGENTRGALYYGDRLSLLAKAVGVQAPAASVFEIGGVSLSRTISPTSPLFGQSGYQGSFLVNDVGGDGALRNGEAFTISVGGGKTMKFTATSASNQGAKGQFNSVAELVTAINTYSEGALRATLGRDADGSCKIAIASANASQKLYFDNVGDRDIVSMFGFDDIGAPAEGVTRVASVQELLGAINTHKSKGLAAELVGNNIRFEAASATSSLKVDGGSSKKRYYQYIQSGSTIAGVREDRRTVTITSSSHGLKAGDYVKLGGAAELLVGAANALPDGVYRVAHASNDTFVIATTEDLVAYGDAPLLNGTPLTRALRNTDPTRTWQKVDGCFASDNLEQAAGRPTDANTEFAAVDEDGFFPVTVHLAAANAFDRLAEEDVVYINNSAVLKTGYYRITALPGGDAFTVDATASDLLDGIRVARVAALNAGIDVGVAGGGAIAAVAPQVAGPATIPGIGGRGAAISLPVVAQIKAAVLSAINAGTNIQAAVEASLNDAGGAYLLAAAAAVAPGALAAAQGAANALATAVSNTVVAVAAGAAVPDAAGRVIKVSGADGGLVTYPVKITNGSSIVTITVPSSRDGTRNHAYNAGDIIKFRNLAGGPAPVGQDAGGGLTYEGIHIAQDTAYRIISVDGNNITIDTATTASPNSQAAADGYLGYGFSYDAGGAEIVHGARAADGSQNFLGPDAYIDYIGAEFNAFGLTGKLEEYFNDPLAPTYDSTDVGKSFAAGTADKGRGYYEQSVTIYDGYGIGHEVIVAFGIISNTKIAVEIFLPKNDQGVYDVTATTAGQVAKGYLTIDGKGQLLDVEDQLKKAVNFQWNNGSVNTSVTFDWGAINGVDYATGKSADPGITYLQGKSTTRYVKSDGNAPGSVVSYDVSRDGVISATFSNGVTRDIYQIPEVKVLNLNGLKDMGGGMYLAVPAESGTATLAVGAFVPKSVKTSAIDSNQKIMDMTDNSTYARSLLKVHSINDKTIEQALHDL